MSSVSHYAKLVQLLKIGVDFICLIGRNVRYKLLQLQAILELEILPGQSLRAFNPAKHKSCISYISTVWSPPLAAA